MSNYFVQELVLYRHFMLIDSPIPFELIANPTNFRKDEHGNVLNTDLSEITGRDICSRPAGAWRIDCWTLLPERYHKQNPVFTMLIKYDKDLLEEGEFVDIRYSDIDIGEGVAGVNGQLVSISASDFRPVILAIEDASNYIADSITPVSDNTESILSFFLNPLNYYINTILDFRSHFLANKGGLIYGSFSSGNDNCNMWCSGLFRVYKDSSNNIVLTGINTKGVLVYTNDDSVIEFLYPVILFSSAPPYAIISLYSGSVGKVAFAITFLTFDFSIARG